MSVKAKTERNFRRARIKPGRRRGRRVWISWRVVRVIGAAGLLIYAGARATDLVMNAPVLRVDRVVVSGNVRLSDGEVEALVHGLHGTSLLTADLAKYRRILLDSPWVADVSLRRILPSSVEIQVSERRPFGICRLGNQLFLVDRTGTVVDEYGPQYSEFDLPIVDGLVRAPSSGQPAIDQDRAAFAAQVIDALEPHRSLATRVSQIDVSDSRDAVILLDNDPARLHLGDARFRERLQSYVEVAAALRERVPEIDYVDLRFEERVYVKPRGRRNRLSIQPSTAGTSF